MALPAGTELGGFEIGRLLGAGGMGRFISSTIDS
jgi:hypothetical protein